MTTIERIHSSGIRRVGRPKSGFRYQTAEGRKPHAKDLARIDQLRIPPAWTDVAINPSQSGRVQVVGKDVAGRWQYLYHETHIKQREKKKFLRLIQFTESLPAMRKAVAANLRKPGLSKERVMACILRILAMSFMRPGSDIYASENGSYGLATLRPRHVSVRGDTVAFDFQGKSGVQQRLQLRNHQVAIVLRELLRHTNRRVFKYEGDDGKIVDVKAKHINDYIREVMGTRFTAKDFRTWSGTLVCACALAREGNELNGNKRERNRKIVAAIKETAAALGNTPAVCRSSYICPSVITAFEKGRIMDAYFESFEKLISYRGVKLHKSEKALLRMLKESA